MKTIILLATVLAFAGYGQANKTTVLPVKVFVNSAEGTTTYNIDGSSITVPDVWTSLAQYGLYAFYYLQGYPIPYVSVDTSIDATLKLTDKSLTLSGWNINLNLPATVVDPVRSILEVILYVIAPPPSTSG